MSSHELVPHVMPLLHKKLFIFIAWKVNILFASMYFLSGFTQEEPLKCLTRLATYVSIVRISH